MIFKGCKLELRLSPQSPLIHFQSSEPGATVRASELKPKLDKFLIKQFKRDGVAYKSWVTKENDNTKAEALDYKVRIRTERPSYKVDIGILPSSKKGTSESYSIYYGNMGEDTVKKDGIISYPIVSIICFKEGLQDQIVKHINDFFYVTNFGTMQSKGFGGFILAGEAPAEEILLQAFKADGAKGIYKIDFGKEGISFNQSSPDYETSIYMFENIKRFYSVMKSGQNYTGFRKGYARSYLFEYMHKKLNIDNEKAWMKELGISPNVEINHSRDVYQKNPNPRYVRAMFGKGDTIRYKSESGRGFENVNITAAASQEKKLERIPSILMFKVIGQSVYILGKSVPEEVYDQEFEFKGLKKKTLATPSHADFPATGGEFPIKDFLDNYVDYYNGDCRKDLQDMNRFKKVVKC